MNEQTSTAVLSMADLAGKYLTFILEAEEYGIEILKVREIIGLMDITEVPRTPECIRGVINLRGKIIPVLDLRAKFGMESVSNTAKTCIIVVDMIADEITTHMGVLVDTVCEVLDIKAEEIEPSPSFGNDDACHFILGMAKRKGKVKILLKVAEILQTKDIVAIAQAVKSNIKQA